MSPNATAEVSAPHRPPVVDYAVYALITRCVCSLGAAFALYGARAEVSRSMADANKDKNWSADTLRHNVDALLRGNMITTLVMIVLVAILIKFLREGRNWARWLYLVFAFLITRDVFQVLGFFQYDHVLTRALTGLVGLSSIAALALLFLPESNAYFRPAGGTGGGLGGMFRLRGAGVLAAARTAAGPNTPGAQPAAQPAAPNTPAADRSAVEPESVVGVEADGTEPLACTEPAAGSVSADGSLSDTSPAGGMGQSAAEEMRRSAADSLTASGSAGSPQTDRRQAPRGKSRQPGRPRQGGPR
ncbi:MAG: hypothetical protein ACJ74U_05725 [Jatrophihabitantaceae bacterium]